jgi:sugar O-acyltransferase (sialic acid O-acetyltransferase NeuD family)
MTNVETRSGHRRLIIIGTGGNALDVLDAVDALNAQGAGWEVVGCLDDETRSDGRPSLPVIGRVEDAARLAAAGGKVAGAAFINVIGSERNHANRAEILARTGLRDEQFATLAHPGAAVSPRVVLGHGCYIGFGASVGGQARVADHVWIGAGCVIGHDSVLDYAAVMAPRATISGFVRLGSCCYIGSAAVVRQRIFIGEQALVGLGAVVIRDVAPRTVVVGNPAAVITPHRRSTGPAPAR